MTPRNTAPVNHDDNPDAEALLERARHEAQERVAELHLEEGTVNSEGGQNSPSPDDQIPHVERSARYRRHSTWLKLKDGAAELGEKSTRMIVEEPTRALAIAALLSAAVTAGLIAIARGGRR